MRTDERYPGDVLLDEDAVVTRDPGPSRGRGCPPDGHPDDRYGADRHRGDGLRPGPAGNVALWMATGGRPSLVPSFVAPVAVADRRGERGTVRQGRRGRPARRHRHNQRTA